MSGICDRKSDPHTGEPAMVRNGIVDKLTGWATAQAVCATLVGRATTGEGRSVEVCMLDVNVATLWPDGMMNHTALSPANKRPDIANGFRLWPTLDGHISFIALTARQVEGIRATFELDEAEIATAGSVRIVAVFRLAGRAMEQLTTEEVLARLDAHDVPASPVVALERGAHGAQVVANQTVEQFEHPVLGAIRQPAPPVRFGGDNPSALRPRHGSAPTTTRSLRCWRGDRADPQAVRRRHPAGRQPPRDQRA